MGKPTGRKKFQAGVEKVMKQNKTDRNTKPLEDDTSVFIQMSQELKEEGNRMFQKRDHEGAMLKYEKALKLLPKSHIEAAALRSNMAACYMQLGLREYPRAIEECNLALEIAPRYTKALLKRARCHEALGKLEWALKDVKTVLTVEPHNLTALEMEDTLKKTIREKGLNAGLSSEQIDASTLKMVKAFKDKVKKKKSNKGQKKGGDVKPTKVEETKDVSVENTKDNTVNRVVEEKKADDKVVVEDKKSIKEEKLVTRTVKLVLRDDIRWAQLPVDCSVSLVREIVRDRFPGLRGVLIKYKDQEGDLVTITTTSELRWAESACDPHGSLRLYLVEVSPDKEPSYEASKSDGLSKSNSISEDENLGKNREVEKVTTCVEEWIVQFARLFKNHVGLDPDSYTDLHELGMELYSEAMEDTVITEGAQELLDVAGAKFQEMSALALFNWGNVHMNKARKWAGFGEDVILEQVKSGYERARKEYLKAGVRYEEALKVKPDFYEGFLALGQQQYEQAKLSWCYALGTNTDLETGPSPQILELYNKAEDNIERGMQVWEELEERRVNGLSPYDKDRADLRSMGLDGFFKDVTVDEAVEQAANMRSQIYILWGTLLYERSIMEFNSSLSTWKASLEASVEKFELAGVSPTDIAAIIKNHCSIGSSSEGLGFKIDEIVQAWNEMYDVKRWQTGVPSFRLEPLFRHRVSKLHSHIEHF